MTAIRYSDIKDTFGSGGANVPPRGSGTPSLRDVLRQLLASTGAVYADATALTASLAANRVDGQSVVKLDDYSTWIWAATSSAGADATHIVPTDSPSVGRWVQNSVADAGDLALTAVAPVDVDDAAAAVGVATVAARGDHKHHIADGTSAAKGVVQLDSVAATSVGAASIAGAGGKASDSAHVHADPMRDIAGAGLTDTATQTILMSDAHPNWRKLGTISQDSTLTLGTAGAVAGDQIDITRTDATSAHTYTIHNGGAGANDMLVMPNSKRASARFQYDGTNWNLRLCGTN